MARWPDRFANSGVARRTIDGEPHPSYPIGKIMRYTLFENQKDVIILVARILLMVLFVMFGWSKLTGFSGTVAYMTSSGAPAPELSAIIAVVMEFVVGVALLVGFFTRPLALL